MQNPNVCQDNARSKGKMHRSGKIFKGCLKPASTKSLVGSIPTHYQNIVYTNNNSRGFGTSQLRFRKQIPDFKGVGEKQNNFYPQPQYKSLRQGYGPLKSKTTKFITRNAKTPGPGTYYNLFFDQTSRNKKKTNRKLKISSSKIQAYPSEQVRNECQNPGPGYYSTEQIIKWNKNNLKGWKSSFTSKGKRDTYIMGNKVPGPGFYHKDSYQKILNQPRDQRQIRQHCNSSKIQAQARKIIRKNRVLAQIPGPGSYNTDIPSFKPFYDMIKVSKNFVCGKKTRFGQDQIEYIYHQQEQNNGPSPFSYKIKSPFDDLAQQKMIQSSFFMSQSKRMPFQTKQSKQSEVSPTDRIVEPAKKVFRFNIHQYWL